MRSHHGRSLSIRRSVLLLGTTSFIVVAGAAGARAQDAAPAPAKPVLVAQAAAPGVQTAQASAPPTEQVPEQVLVTGSLIRGAVAVGVPVTSFSANDFATAGAFQTS